jgi:hypothetical protein
VRPARSAKLETGRAQSVAIQFATSGAAFHTVRSGLLTDPYGYFDVLQVPRQRPRAARVVVSERAGDLQPDGQHHGSLA